MGHNGFFRNVSVTLTHVSDKKERTKERKLVKENFKNVLKFWL